MTKYVVPVPNPAPGADWQTVVPGIYTYDVVGITATLVTTSTPLAAQQLFYGATNSGTNSLLLAFINPFSVSEDQMVLASNQSPLGQSDPFPSIADGLRHMLAWVWDGTDAHYYVDGVNVPVSVPTPADSAPSPMTLTELGLTGPASEIIDELSAHRSALSAGDIAALYAAGLAGFSTYSPAVLAFTPETYYHFDGPGPTVCVDASGNGNDGTYFTSGGGTPEFVPGLVTGDDALRWAATNPIGETVLRPSPLGIDWTSPFTLILWESLDASGPSTGRTPSLVVSNGTDDVLVIPAGFQAVSTPGPYAYAWQPGLNADTQSTDGTLTTVAIPKLVIPAGYTVGTQTFDLEPTDQWSQVAVWWDDSAQQLGANLGAYDYGNGAHLIYRQIGNQP